MNRPRIFLFRRNWGDDRLHSWVFVLAPQWDDVRQGERVKCGVVATFAFGPSRYEIEDNIAHRWRLWPVNLHIEFGRGPEPKIQQANIHEVQPWLGELCYSEPPS